MTPFGPYYPLVLDAVMRHAERLTELLALRERALSHNDPGRPWIIGRAAELRCVASVLGADWHGGRLSADVAAVELAQYVRHLHQGLAEQLGIRKPACCYIGLLAQLVVASILLAMVGACARGSVDGSFDVPAPLEASAPFLPSSAAHDEFAREASASVAHESAFDAGASPASGRVEEAATADASATAAVSNTVPSLSPADAGAAEEDASLSATQTTDAAPAYERPETSTSADAHDASEAPVEASLGETADSAQSAPDSLAESTSSLPIASVPQLGELLITEVMFEPSGSVPDSEWFEVFNLTDSPKLLSGLTILDGYSDPHVITSIPPVAAPPHSYVLLVRDRVAALAGGVSPACIVYEYGAAASPYGGIELGGAGGEVSLWNGNTQLAVVPYGQWTPAPLAQSIELGVLQLVGSDVADNWCLAQHPWGAGTDDGTPGAASDCR